MLDAASNDPKMCVFISICSPYIYSPSCRLETTKRELKEMFELQKLGTSASVESQPASSSQSILEQQEQLCSKEGFGVPPGIPGWPHNLCSQTDLPRAKAVVSRGTWECPGGVGCC